MLNVMEGFLKALRVDNNIGRNKENRKYFRVERKNYIKIPGE